MQVKETEKSDFIAELRQGDILQIEQVEPIGQAPSLGVIINADCDLAHCKTDGVIAYLPIYTFRNYLEYFWAPSHISDVINVSKKTSLELCKLKDNEGIELLEWLKISQPNEILEKLNSSANLKNNEKKQLETLLAKLNICINQETQPLKAFGNLCKLEKEPLAYANKHLSAAKKAMGDGHFFISDLHGCEEIGFVVRMRRIYTLDADCCFTSISKQKASSNGNKSTAVRIARLTNLYQFKVAQMFAHQYSRIGLPDEITLLGNLAVDDLASQIIGVSE